MLLLVVLSVAVKFRLPRLRGKSMGHAPLAGCQWGASMAQKGVMPNSTANPSEHSRIWLREKPVSDPSLFQRCETELIRTAKRHGTYEGVDVEWVQPVSPSSSAESRSLSSTANGNMERGNHHGCSPIWEKVASRMLHGGRIVSEANAQGNAWDTLTETR